MTRVQFGAQRECGTVICVEPDADRCDDVPSPIDLRDPNDARKWVESADHARPWRAQFRDAIADRLGAIDPPVRRVLELGSGPGLLAERILQRCSLENYTLLDFSEPMLAMSRERLAGYEAAAFLLGNFGLPNWNEAITTSPDVIVAMQAVHEIRHKRRVPSLYRQIRDVLQPGGRLLVCDHVPNYASPRSSDLHSTETEQHAALAAAGFIEVETLLSIDRLILYSGRRATEG